MLRKHIKKLDNLWANIVKEKAGWRCEHCGRKKSDGWKMEAAHVVGRRYRKTRWGSYTDEAMLHYDLCGHCLCHMCHQNYDEHGPLEDEIIDVTIGRDRKLELQYMANNDVAKYQDYEEIKSTLEEQLW